VAGGETVASARPEAGEEAPRPPSGCRGARYLAGYRYPGSGLWLWVGPGGEALVEAEPGGICILLPERLVWDDVSEGALADAYAGLLLAPPAAVVGDRELLWSHITAYARRLLGEENYRFRRLLGEHLHRHALAARIAPLAARMARLARFYTWLRPLYRRAFLDPEGARWLHRVASTYSGGSLWLRLAEEPAVKPSRLPGATGARAAVELALEAASLDLLRAIPREALMEGVLSPMPPPLRDPVLFLRLDHARLATKLLGFEEQLHALTGVARLLRLRRRGVIRSARLVETPEGFRPAIVKTYRDLSMAKWLLAALLSLPLPQPRLGPKKRLGAEYHYNRLLASLGYNVASPILVDPRRRMAAYTYIEGRTLVDLLRENSSHPIYHRYGGLLARLHRDGIALWDTNPTNAIVTPGGSIYLVDLEQAREAASLAEKAWDIAVAVYYSIPYSVSGAPERAVLLARGYIEAGGSPEAVLEASRYRYAAPFAAVVPPNVLEKTRRSLARAAGSALGGGQK
jgi:tRNA A-37 threonylcarbamoyl transferase component Bud32